MYVCKCVKRASIVLKTEGEKKHKNEKERKVKVKAKVKGRDNNIWANRKYNSKEAQLIQLAP